MISSPDSLMLSLGQALSGGVVVSAGQVFPESVAAAVLPVEEAFPGSVAAAVLPVEEAFPGSVLEAPLEALAGSASALSPWWWQALIVLTIVTMLLNIPNLRFIGVRLLDCIWRWRGNYILEASIPYQKARNILAASMLLPFGLMVYRFGLVDFRWLGAYFLLRPAMHLSVLGTVRAHRSDCRHGGICFANYFIILVVLMLVTLAVLTIFRDSADDAVRMVLRVECGLVYLLHFVRKRQILRSVFPALRVFLYLCALEIVPTGLLLAASVLL